MDHRQVGGSIELGGSSDLIAGGIVTFLAAALGGGAGFGYALAATPFLLLLGYPPEFVVTVNLTLGFLTRSTVAYRFRYYVTPRRVLMLLGGSIPGMLLGILALTMLDTGPIKMGTGIIVIAGAILLIWTSSNPPPEMPIPGGPVIAGLTGGFLGTTTSLSGIPAAILFIRERLKPIQFLADMASFFVLSNSIALMILYFSGAIVLDALFPAAVLWLPGSLAGNLIGAQIGARLPPGLFRKFTLGVILVAGIITIATA